MINSIKILCPYCGQPYMPAEIYVPNAFFGKPSKLEKDEYGTLEYNVGKDMDLYESYCCDQCNNKFYVHANLSFDTSTTPFNSVPFVLKRKKDNDV